MHIELARAPKESQALLSHLFQYYVYDFSETVGADVSEDGTFALPPLERYWEDPWRHPFLARVDGKYAGFALIHRRSRITADPGTSDVAEFLVMRRYRRRGVGRSLARQVFDAFRGPWEVRQLFGNQIATAFWRSVVADYTNGRFDEVVVDNDAWRGPVQRFDNSVR